MALCKETDFVHEIVYGKVLTDLKKIEQGEEIDGQYVKGSLVFITGDNLGSHGLGRIYRKFQQYFCRFCLITKDEFHAADGMFNLYTQRTIESYNETVKLKNKRTFIKALNFLRFLTK